MFLCVKGKEKCFQILWVFSEVLVNLKLSHNKNCVKTVYSFQFSINDFNFVNFYGKVNCYYTHEHEHVALSNCKLSLILYEERHETFWGELIRSCKIECLCRRLQGFTGVWLEKSVV